MQVKTVIKSVRQSAQEQGFSSYKCRQFGEIVQRGFDQAVATQNYICVQLRYPGKNNKPGNVFKLVEIFGSALQNPPPYFDPKNDLKIKISDPHNDPL